MENPGTERAMLRNRRRISPGRGISASLLFWCQLTMAQTVSLDNVPPIALTSSAVVGAFQVDPATGNVTVRTALGTYNQCSAPVGPAPIIISFTTNVATVSPGATIVLDWTSVFTTSCTPQLGQGTVWASLGLLPVSGNLSIAAPATVGTVTFQLTCTNGSQSAIATRQVLVQGG